MANLSAGLRRLLEQVSSVALFHNGLICYPFGSNVDSKSGNILIVSPSYIATQ